MKKQEIKEILSEAHIHTVEEISLDIAKVLKLNEELTAENILLANKVDRLKLEFTAINEYCAKVSTDSLRYARELDKIKSTSLYKFFKWLGDGSGIDQHRHNSIGVKLQASISHARKV